MKVVGFLLLQILWPSFGLSLTYRENHVFTIEFEKDEPDYSLPTPDMIRSYGYPCEVHQYTTEDGYINTLHRIPKANPKGVVFVQHGIFGTSADFVMGAPKSSLGYFLHDLGYDVWLGNARGNRYSRLHHNLTTKDHQYWQFSWMEMAMHDVPAALDHVLSSTSRDKLFYIGHSMGTTMFWAALNDNPSLKDKIELMVAMGPVAKVQHIISPLRLLAPYVKEVDILFKLLGVDEFEPSNNLTKRFIRYACDETMIQEDVCENVLFLLTGFDDAQANKTLLPYILGHEPGGASVNTLVHYAQMVNSGRFSRFDYGSRYMNIKKYGVPVPPSYDLKKVDVPVALIWANNDWLADPRDVQFLVDGLSNVVKNYKVPFAKFNHIDFLWAIDAPKLVFEPIANLLVRATK